MSVMSALELALGRAAIGRSIRHLMATNTMDEEAVTHAASMRGAIVFKVRGPRPLDQMRTALCMPDEDLEEGLERVCRDATETSRPVLILALDLSSCRREELGELIECAHQANQKGWPLVLFGEAGPHAHRLCGDARSYAERMFVFVGSEGSPVPSFG